MRYIDLHVHSTCSDGTLTPEELVLRGIKNDLVAFALTDHDTVEGVARAIRKAEELDQHIQVIPGVELSCQYPAAPDQNVEIHILGYNIDHTNSALVSTLKKVAEERDNWNIWPAFGTTGTTATKKCVKIFTMPDIPLPTRN